MAQATGSYKPSEVVIVINHPTLKASHVVNGFMEDSIVSIERDNPTWTHYVGADGGTSRVHNVDKSVQATIMLQNTSASNDVLQEFLDYDEAGSDVSGMFSITIADKSGRSVSHSTQAYVSGQPSQEFGNNISVREWVIRMTYAETKIGGNAKINQDVIDTLAIFGVEVDSRWYEQ